MTNLSKKATVESSRRDFVKVLFGSIVLSILPWRLAKKRALRNFVVVNGWVLRTDDL